MLWLWVACTTGSEDVFLLADPASLPRPPLGTFRILPVGPAQGAYRLDVDCAELCRVELTLDDGGRAHRVRYAPLATEHVLPVVGVRPDRDVEARVRLVRPSGDASDLDAQTFRSTPLDFEVPDIDVLRNEGSLEPGWTVFPQGTPDGWTFATDAHGEVVWGFALAGATQGIKGLKISGEAELWGVAAGRIVRADLAGQVLDRYGPADDPLATVTVVDRFHHDVWPRSGGVTTLTHEDVDVDAYPVSEAAPDTFAPARIRSDVVATFDRSGLPRARWSLADVLDTRRIGYGSVGDGNGWTHANAVVAFEDQLIVSSRHQDAVVSVDADTGALRWILGHPEGWRSPWSDALLEPADAQTTWPFHQHAPDVRRLDADRIEVVLFDNGNEARTSPYQTAPHPDGDFSRVVAYVVDEAAGTVRQTFEFVGDGAGDPLFSATLGNADHLPVTGHVLATYGSVAQEGGIDHVDRGRGRRSARVIEIDRASGRAVWDVRLSTRLEDDERGWRTDRVQRVPSLYGDLAVVDWLSP